MPPVNEPLSVEQCFSIASIIQETREKALLSRDPSAVWEDALREVLTYSYMKDSAFKNMLKQEWGLSSPPITIDRNP